MLEHTVLYTSDLHGNKRQFETFIEYAIQTKAATLIIGGDLAPKNVMIDTHNSGYIDVQRNFLRNELPALFRTLKQSLPNTKVFVMLGNDDCSVNEDILAEQPELYQNINGKRLKIDECYEIVGYPFVPITPFSIKDFEKFDLTAVPEWAQKSYIERKRSYRLQGIRTKKEGLAWMPYTFSAEQEKCDSIQKDLAEPLFTVNSNKTIYVFHTPPNYTSLDVTQSNDHVGSFAVREFIQKYQPPITLHGHIHETVDMTGAFIEKIGQSLAMSAGNHNYDARVAVLAFNLYDAQNCSRIKLPVDAIGKFFSKVFKS